MARASRRTTEPENGAAEAAGGVAPVGRALLIVSAIEASDTPPELSEIATRTGVRSLSGPREQFGIGEIERMKRVPGPVAIERTLSLGGQWPEGLCRSSPPACKAGNGRASA